MNEGCVHVCAVWDKALTEDELALLAQGTDPAVIRPAALVFFDSKEQ